MGIHVPGNPMARISDIAKRLGVDAVECPVDSLVAKGSDDKTYDVWAVASAFLDKMEKRVAGPEEDLIAAVTAATGSYWWGLVGGVLGAGVFGALLEYSVLRHFYQRDHLSQVLGTFAILLMCNEGVRLVWGAQPVPLNTPE